MPNHKYIIAKFSSLITLVCVSILYASNVHAQTQPYTFVPLATLPGLTTAFQGLTPGTVGVNPTTYIQGLYAFAIGIGAIIAVVTGVIAGIEYMLSESSIASKSKAIERIKNVGWGAALLFSSWLLLNLINPQLVNWNLNLGIINTANLNADLTANQAALQAINAQTNAAMQAEQTSEQAAATAQQSLSTLQDECNNGTPDSPDYGMLNPNVCDTTDPTSQISQATVAANVAQSTVIENAASVTANQAAGAIRTAADTDSPATAQADLITADRLLTTDATQVAALGNTAAVTQITAQKIVMDSSAAQTLALAPIIAATPTSNFFNSPDVQNALNSINTAIQQVATLQSEAQNAATPAQAAIIQAQATALQAQITANQATLNTAVQKVIPGCSPAQYASQNCPQ